MSLRPLATLCLVLLAAPALAAEPVGSAAPSAMAAHRALYDLTLESTKGADINAVHGTMAFEITDACDGWATRQRLSLSITNRDDQTIETVSDYITWESKDGLFMRFRMKQTTDTALTEQAEGEAKLEALGGEGTIHYTMPHVTDMKMPRGTAFPMMHTEAMLAAAEAGKKYLGLPIFDGTGDKGAQDSSIIVLNWGPPAPAPQPVLATLPSGRFRIAFFDRKKPAAKDKPDGSPDYEVTMKYWANGVADDLHMDFSEFIMKGTLKDFALQPPHC